MAERDLRAPLAGALSLALAGACGPRHVAPPPRIACVEGVRPGLRTPHVAWNGRGWSALVIDGHRLFLRALAADGDAVGDPLLLSQDARDLEGASLVVSDGVERAAFVERSSGVVQVVRASSGAEPRVASLDTPLAGALALVARPGRGAALFVETMRGVELATVAEDGDLGARAACPRGVLPGAVVAQDDGYVALAATSREGVQALWLDDRCRLRARRVLSASPGSAHVRAMAADAAGPWVAYTDDAGAAWVAALGAAGLVRVAPRRLDGGMEHPSVVVEPDARGVTQAVRVLGLRRTEVDARLVELRYDAAGRYIGLRSLLPDPVSGVEAVAPSPWGGAVVAFRRTDVAGNAGYSFLLRVCP